MSEPDHINMIESDDPEMAQASARARESFRYFWRELSWEARRIVPAHDLAAVKIAFTDGDSEREGPSHEHMWVGEVGFDGTHVTGTLMNAPTWLTNISEGDAVRAPLAELGDWMFAIGGKVHGAFTVNLIRSRMEADERQAHDEAWGLDFGDPHEIALVYEAPKKKGLLGGMFGKKAAPDADPLVEHPMSINMGEGLREQLKATPAMLQQRDERGWTLLHSEALAGNLTTVRVLIESGAEASSTTEAGETAADLAARMGWAHVVAYLQAQG